MNTMKMNGYLVSVSIPWDKDGVFSSNLFRKAINKLSGESCDGLYLFGTSGEGYSVTDAEYTSIVDVFADATDKFNGFRQVGCFGLSSDQVKNRCRIAVERGIESVQITLPCWKELNDEELKRYFLDVCNSFPELDFLFYNNPQNKRKLKGKELEAIHKIAPNLLGAKTGAGSWIDFYELITESPSLVNFVTEGAFLYSYGLGNNVGLIPSSNYVFPQRSRAYYEAVISNDLDNAHRLHKDIMRFFYKTAIPLVNKGYIDGAIDKAYSKIGDMEMPLYMKSPYIPLSNEDYEWLENLIKNEFSDETI
ncbi:MAG: dihydrodipicolinate synthase family protein [Bacteroidota bacterium]